MGGWASRAATSLKLMSEIPEREPPTTLPHCAQHCAQHWAQHCALTVPNTAPTSDLLASADLVGAWVKASEPFAT